MKSAAGLRAIGMPGGPEPLGLKAWESLSGELEAGSPKDRYGNPLAGGRDLLQTLLDDLAPRRVAWPGGAPYAVALSHDLDDPIKGQLAYGLADRKSTRLNSSH